jgi:hypothetical protein
LRLASSLLALLAAAVPLAAQLRVIETQDLRLLFYDPRHTYLAPQLMRGFENAFQFHKRIFRYQPSGQVNILLEDFADYGHGGADVIPINHVNVGIGAVNYTYETVPSNERMTWMMNHELAHVAEMDGSRGSDRFFRRLFGLGAFPGKVAPRAEDPISMAYAFLSVPRRYAPRWYHEGLAVFLETWMAGGMGRSLGGYDEMVFRALVRDDARIYDLVGLDVEGTTIDFQVGVNSYLYGTRFLSWLAIEYGPEKVVQWAASEEGSKAYYAAQFRQVFGRPIAREWSRWIEAERAWQRENLASIDKYPVTPVQRISRIALGSVSNSFFDESTGRLLAAVRYPGPMAHLAAIDPGTGEAHRLHEVEGAALFFVTSLAFDPSGRRLFYTTHNNNWRDLHVYDLDARKDTRLIADYRAGDIAFDRAARSLWGVRHVNGLSIIVESPPPYKEIVSRHELPYGHDLFDLDVSPDGRTMVAMFADTSGRQKLVQFETGRLRDGDASMQTLHDFEFSSGASFRFTPDGSQLYGTSYFTGASNIFRFDFSSRSMDILTNTETGLFWPQMLADGRLLAYEYTAKGFYPVVVQAAGPLQDVNAVKYFGQQIVEKHPVVRQWKLPPPEKIDLEKLTTRAGEFSTLRNLRPYSLYPIVQGYKDTAAAGARLDFTDGLGLSSLSITGSYSPDAALAAGERFHFGLDLHHWAWRIQANYNKADFYDLFGPTKQSLKGFEGIVGYRKNLRYKAPRSLDLDWSIAGYAGLDRVPDYQNVRTPFDKLLTARLGLAYSNLSRSLGAVDDEKGYRWKLSTLGNAVNSRFFPRFYGLFDYGFLTPIRNSPIWIRTSAGKSFGNRLQPFANFYFGGFGNNYVDHLDISRYREYYSFPGVNLNQIGATGFGKTLVEWNLPPLRFRSFGVPWLYCNWVRPTVFSGVIVGNLASSRLQPIRPAGATHYLDAGAQLDFRVVISSYLNTTFSVGYAAAQDRHGRRSTELMLSLRLL